MLLFVCVFVWCLMLFVGSVCDVVCVFAVLAGLLFVCVVGCWLLFALLVCLCWSPRCLCLVMFAFVCLFVCLFAVCVAGCWLVVVCLWLFVLFVCCLMCVCYV